MMVVVAMHPSFYTVNNILKKNMGETYHKAPKGTGSVFFFLVLVLGRDAFARLQHKNRLMLYVLVEAP